MKSTLLSLTSVGVRIDLLLSKIFRKQDFAGIFAQNPSQKREHLNSLFDARENIIIESKIERKIYPDGTEILIIHPENINFLISWDKVYTELPSKSMGKLVEIWIQERDFPEEEKWGRVYRILNGYLIRVKLPKTDLTSEALSRLVNFKLLWGLGILSGLPDPDSYGKALHACTNKILVNSSSPAA